jgi:hypothetical protein
MKKPPEILNKIVDTVLAYRPKGKIKPARKRLKVIIPKKSKSR